MMACKGICLRYKAQKPVDHIGRYIIGQKRCQACETYIQWNNFWCPCCGYRLRTKPRNSRNKTNFRVQYAKQAPSVCQNMVYNIP